MNLDLSYIIATRNRFSFLRITLEILVNELQPNEEIVVVDGNSSDGTKEYLQQLFEEGKIHQFISEPDRNQAHGWNKALLMAKGTIIKKIIDDDVHDFKAIRRCGDFMLANPEIDICISNCLGSNLIDPGKIETASRLPYFMKWKSGVSKTFTFSDVSMLVRRSSLSFVGLYDTQFKMMDWEYSLRASYLQARIAYYTGYNSLAVNTPGNVTSTATRQLFKTEENIGRAKYRYAGDSADISLYSHIKIWMGKTMYKLSAQKKEPANLTAAPPANQLEQIYASFYKKLGEYNEGRFDFIYTNAPNG
jgi:glycosyltransferase involved in cell wall biosynthesis